MKKFVTFLSVALFSLLGYSATYNVVIVNLTDGTNVKIRMNDDLRLMFDRDNLVAKGGDTEVALPKSDVVNFEHSYDSDMDEVNNFTNDQNIVFSNGQMEFHNLPSPSTVIVYDLSGKVLFEQTCEGDYCLSFDGFEKGVHIVLVNGVSYKVIIK